MTVRLRPPLFADPLVGSALGANLDTGCTNQTRETGVAWTFVTASGSLALSYFRVPRAFTAANMAYYTTATAAGATPTLVKYALFSIAANGDLTRIAITASNTANFAAPSTRYPQALLVGVALTPGVTYASGMLLTTGAALPTLLSALSTTPANVQQAVAPRLTGVIAAQTDILTSYTAAQVTNIGARYFAEITT